MQWLLVPWQLIFSARCLKSHLTVAGWGVGGGRGLSGCRVEAAAQDPGTLTPPVEEESGLPPRNRHRRKAAAQSGCGHLLSSPRYLPRYSQKKARTSVA